MRREASRHGADARIFRSANHREPHEATQGPPISVSGNRTFQGSAKPWPAFAHYSLSRDKPPMSFDGEPSAHCLRYEQAPWGRRSDAPPLQEFLSSPAAISRQSTRHIFQRAFPAAWRSQIHHSGSQRRATRRRKVRELPVPRYGRTVRGATILPNHWPA